MPHLTTPSAQSLPPSPHSVLKMAPHSKQRRFSSSSVVPDSVSGFAFAFDIDGVLLRSAAPIPGAPEALAFLYNHNIPFILLTNGGGKHESARVAELSKKLGVPLTEENFVQSHTPFKQLVGGLQDKTILVTGGDGDQCRKVAEKYGFKNVVTPGDIIMECPAIWPFNQIFSDYYKSATRPLPTPINHTNPAHSLKIDAVFVFNDPRDWALDTQIILDLLLSKNGVLGTTSEKNGDPSLPNNGWQQDGQPQLFFSNPDLFWATSYHMARLGQGGFQASLQGVWDATTNGAALKRTIIGKPHAATYEYAERVLDKYRAQMLGAHGGRVGQLDRVFMVGDNPESDIRGANDFKSAHGTEWTSILVKTGVFQDGTKPAYKPKVVVNDVLEAVKWAVHQQGWKGKAE
ncbi:putative CDP-alcohol phosphatidyltransferase class-I family protein [Lachnellula cervina]|uniref:Putative CDP-alcohol phosphatidyltransferase class-I family protein n=1 Tax=Lachnellula cervina TaxID=1316786 RepID=A0A7D8UTM5_9HELO|nr:putative CDP-alcohol phosphatidyltransferase class-I family protein [Lachnellula cervina]